MYIFRAELDYTDTPDKYQELFCVTLDLVVSPRDRPRPDQSSAWEGFAAKGLNPKILFTTKEEQQQIMADFGMCKINYTGKSENMGRFCKDHKDK